MPDVPQYDWGKLQPTQPARTITCKFRTPVKQTDETAKAWGLTDQEVAEIRLWVASNVDQRWQSQVFTKLLKRKSGYK